MFSLVSHNAFWFQGAPYGETSPGAPAEAVLDGLAALYRSLAPDLLCLQEVQDAPACMAVARRVGMRGHFCTGGAHGQYGGAVMGRLGSPAASSSKTAAPPAQRFWQVHAWPLQNGDTLPVCNLHLASHRQLGEEEAAQSRITDLGRVLGLSPAPSIVAGDFNEGPDGGTSALMQERGYIDTAVLTGCAITSTGTGKGRSDQIWVSGALAERVSGFEVVPWGKLACDLPGITHLSDHLPLILRLDLE
jgi:endonuclease/exonuclease/phosphatase family metal-dependent hydrolase